MASAPDLSLRGGRRPTWQSREGTYSSYRLPIKRHAPIASVAALSERHAGWQHVPYFFCGARPPDLSLRGGRRPTWRPEREARGSALGVQSREGTCSSHRLLIKPYRRNRCAPFCRSPVRITAVAPGGACPSPTRRLRSAKYPKNRSCPRGVEDVAPYKAPPILREKIRGPYGPRRRFILPCRPVRAAIFSAGRKTGHTR